jgi:N-acetylglutamate synthase-like GNAT family acetyltransferase
MIYTWQRGNYSVCTDPDLLDLDIIHEYLLHSYWSPGVPREVVARAIEHSLCFGLYADGGEGRAQIGFARLVTDQATFAYFADVFVLEKYRDAGLGVWLIDCMMHCPAIDGVRSLFLQTRDAHSLYEKFGFETVSDTGRMMALRHQMAWYRPELAEG